MTTRHRTAVDMLCNNLAGSSAPVQPHYSLARAMRMGSSVGAPISFVMASPGEKRDGMSLDLRKMDLRNFWANPIALWMHGQSIERGSVPIGRWLNTHVTREGDLVGDLEFDRDDAFSANLERQYRSGFLTSVSISWFFTGRESTELLEASAVAIPADPDARKRARSLWVVGRDQQRQVGGEVIARKGDGALVRVGSAPRVSTSDRLSVLRRRAEPELLVDTIEMWAALNQNPPFRHPRAGNAESFAAKARDAIRAARAAFDKGDITVDQARREFDRIREAVRDYARTIPPLDNEISDYILSNQYAKDLDNYEGDLT